jgi:hypothetical protein
MFWIGTAVTSAAGIVALMMVVTVKRPTDVGDLGSVSDRWIAEHRVNVPWTVTATNTETTRMTRLPRCR